MKRNNYNKKPYEAPAFKEFRCSYARLLSTLSLDGDFDEIGFEFEDDSVFGWGTERSGY